MPAPSQDPELLRRLLRAKDRMDAASHEDWPVERLARVSHVSRAHFARSFACLAPGGRGVRIQVVDTGTGMPAAQLDQIFDVFYQIDRAKLEQQGSGSGLAIAQGIARMHGGEITAVSTVDKGSTFTMEIPKSKDERCA